MVVTGAAGFVGGRLSTRLTDLGALCLPWSRREVDLLDREKTLARMGREEPTLVVHLAASLKGRSHPGWVPPDNLTAALHVLEAAAGVRVLHVGTLDEYGDGATPFDETQAARPLTLYAAGKAAAGLYVAQAGGVHVRLALVYGPGQDERFFIPQLLGALRRREPFDMTAGDQVRDFIYIDDVVEGLVRLLASEVWGRTVNLCSGQGRSLKEVVGEAQNVAGACGLVNLGKLPYRPREVFCTVGSNARLAALTGWRPATSLETGLRRAWDDG